jgi:drug/metabolite transporter (DMT)-like permease
MAAVLALLTSALYSAADFFGGIATKRNPVAHVVLGAQIIGLGSLLAVVWFFNATFRWTDAGYGAIGGLAGLAGIVLLYRGLARGPMAVVAPITALVSAALPVGWDVIGGNRPGVVQGLGLLLGLAAIVVMSSGSSDMQSAPVTTRVITEALLAGAGFGGFFILLDYTADNSAPWPIVSARVAAVMSIVIVSLIRSNAPRIQVDRIVVGAGLCDTAANVTYLLALEHGSLATVAVLGSLYPVGTVLLARTVLRERLTSTQLAGLGVTLLAVVLIAGG